MGNTATGKTRNGDPCFGIPLVCWPGHRARLVSLQSLLHIWRSVCTLLVVDIHEHMRSYVGSMEGAVDASTLALGNRALAW